MSTIPHAPLPWTPDEATGEILLDAAGELVVDLVLPVQVHLHGGGRTGPLVRRADGASSQRPPQQLVRRSPDSRFRLSALSGASLGASKFDEMVRDGRMPKPKRIDGCVVWDLRRLDLAWDALGGDDGAPNPWD